MVLAAANTYIKNNASFSAYDLTTFIRNKINDDEWATRTKGGKDEIKHDSVKEVWQEILELNLWEFNKLIDLLNILQTKYNP